MIVAIHKLSRIEARQGYMGVAPSFFQVVHYSYAHRSKDLSSPIFWKPSFTQDLTWRDGQVFCFTAAHVGGRHPLNEVHFESLGDSVEPHHVEL